jgi:hypothetical protein
MGEKKKCKECGAPLEGILFNTIGKLFGIKESTEGYCNKCKPTEEKIEEEEKIEDTAEPKEEENQKEDKLIDEEKIEDTAEPKEE